MAKLPAKFKPLFWSDRISDLDTKEHKGYIIHQILQYGTFADIRWLIKTYGKKEIITTFINHPSKTYPKKVYYFIKNYLLGLKNLDLDEQDYITSIFGPLRQRQAKNI